MRSSAIAAFRAIVMLATLAVLLLAACLYNSPERRSELLETITQSRWLSDIFFGDGRGQDDEDRFAFASPQPLAEAPPWQLNPGRGASMPHRRHDPAVQAAGYEYRPEASSSGHRKDDGVQSPFYSPSAAAVRPAYELDSQGPGSLRSRGDAPIASRSVDGQADGFGQQDTRAEAGGPDRFTRIERRLRELGATYYLLESRGTESNLFRFHCRMAIGGARHHNRHFEATDKDPLGAMSRVLREVERWRLSRGP